jgi:hypothetical protein
MDREKLNPYSSIELNHRLFLLTNCRLKDLLPFKRVISDGSSEKDELVSNEPVVVAARLLSCRNFEKNAGPTKALRCWNADMVEAKAAGIVLIVEDDEEYILALVAVAETKFDVILFAERD